MKDHEQHRPKRPINSAHRDHSRRYQVAEAKRHLARAHCPDRPWHRKLRTSMGRCHRSGSEAPTKRQLDEDTKRYEQSIALANQIRQKATEVSKHVSEWALQTRNAGLEIRNVFERLNGGVHLSQE